MEPILYVPWIAVIAFAIVAAVGAYWLDKNDENK
jgi:hypothetical protein